jgi:hypothetical protein
MTLGTVIAALVGPLLPAGTASAADDVEPKAA